MVLILVTLDPIMKKIILILVIIGVIAAVYAFKKKTVIAPEHTQTPTATASISPSPTISAIPTASQKQTFIISFNNGAATPVNLTINAGDTVKFVNNEGTPHWPASGIHPTHQICPGFDSLHGLAKDESYSFTFNEAKTCPWHDHLNLSLKGQIIINP